MKIKTSKFITSAVKPSQYPSGLLPEIAFSGRSNVGKSSLINSLINRKHLVKTSSTPGRTRLINFFNINKSFVFVDLPGYGYARVPASVKKKWKPMIETYFMTREMLRCVVLIMDIRRIPGQDEPNFIDWLNQAGIPSLLILTKADKLSKTRQKKQQIKIADVMDIKKDDLIIFSAKTLMGKDVLWSKIKHYL